MYLQNAIETTAKVRTSQSYKISDLIPAFIRHVRFEMSLSPNTAVKYEECLRFIVRDLGDLNPADIGLMHLTELKQKIMTRGAGEARVGSMVFALKSFMKFCKETLELEILDYKKIKSPKRHRREVLFLTGEEIQQFLDVIPLEKKWNGRRLGWMD